MKGRALALALLLGGAQAAGAAPCVSPTFDTPLAGAQNVVTRQVDVPSPQFPGLWQEGTLDGFFYTLYANGEGVLRAGPGAGEWELRVLCAPDAATCTRAQTGTPPDAAQPVASVLGQCLLGEVAAAPAPEVIATPAPEEAAAPCGVAAVPEGTPIAILQSLLAAAGSDPGPVDGLMGGKTRDALLQVLGEEAATLDTDAAIAALDTLLCTAPE